MPGALRLAAAVVAAFILLGIAAAGDGAGKAKRILYDFSVTDGITGKDVALAKYQDKPVVLVVNVASECGYTDKHYRQLQALYDKYSSSGLEILAFPCNSFGQQEPGSDAEIADFVKTKYSVTFPVFQKVEVNGPRALQLFQWLKAETPQDPQHSFTHDTKWNFEKFLVVNGLPTKRFAHDHFPVDFEKDIVQALRKAAASEL